MVHETPVEPVQDVFKSVTARQIDVQRVPDLHGVPGRRVDQFPVDIEQSRVLVDTLRQ
jgi:hypothetical protein